MTRRIEDRIMLCYHSGWKASNAFKNAREIANKITSGETTSDETWNDFSRSLAHLQLAIGESKICNPDWIEQYNKVSDIITHTLNTSVKNKQALRLFDTMSAIGMSMYGAR